MLLEQEQRSVYYDHDLEIEAYHLTGIIQRFPMHFHEYFVLGFMERGRRHLSCQNKEYDLKTGAFILFNPQQSHGCAPDQGELLDYRAVNIKPEIMNKVIFDLTGGDSMPQFNQTVIYQDSLTKSLSELYQAIVSDEPKSKKEEALFFLIEQILVEDLVSPRQLVSAEPNLSIKALCTYMEEHFADSITLDHLLTMTTYGKSYLLRSFSQQIGVSPYRYLQNIRINISKRQLEQGIAPVEVAALTGFSDQSHFTNTFKHFIGLTPKQYQRIFTDKDKETEG